MLLDFTKDALYNGAHALYAKLGSFSVIYQFMVSFINLYSSVTVFLLCLIFIGFAKQLKNYAPNQKERPLPYHYVLIIQILNVLKYVVMAYFSYVLIFNGCVFYMTLYDAKFQFNGVQSIYIDYAILFVEWYILFVYLKKGWSNLLFLNPLIDRLVIKKLNNVSAKYQFNNSDRDVYNPDGATRQHKKFKVEKQIKNNYLFHGLDEKGKGVYTDFFKSLDGHYSIIGGSGMGKGVMTVIYLMQFIKNGLPVFILDPKPDDNLYNACCYLSSKYKRKMHVFDLDERVPQLSLFKGIDRFKFRSILMSTLELSKQKQTNARVYAERAERALFKIAECAYEENITPNELLDKMKNNPETMSEESVVNLFYYLDECKIFNTRQGLGFGELLSSSDIVYIRCRNAKNDDVSRFIAGMTVTTLFNHVNNRSLSHAKHCVAFIDEFKFLMNTQIMDNLATIRSQKCSLIFNFQDMSNFMTSPNAALRNSAYVQELLSNSQFIGIHNLSEPALIKLVQQKVGKKLYWKSMEHDISNSGGVGETSSDKRWTNHIDYKLTENEVSTGEKMTAILLSNLFITSRGEAFTRVHTWYINTKQYDFKISYSFESSTDFNNSEMLNVDVQGNDLIGTGSVLASVHSDGKQSSPKTDKFKNIKAIKAIKATTGKSASKASKPIDAKEEKQVKAFPKITKKEVAECQNETAAQAALDDELLNIKHSIFADIKED
ncbi:MAG: hypothetical protein O2809_00745 [Proteobacteria bacterium]|nr:hypothetical protein [Pseudomonadota bacterium]